MHIFIVMLPLIYVGVISLSSSICISHFITREILRNIFKSNIKEKKIDSKVKFKKEIRVRYIPSRKNISNGTLERLWYSQNDYNSFKNNFLKLKKYNSI